MAAYSAYENLVAAHLDCLGVSYAREVTFYPPPGFNVHGRMRVDFCVYDWNVIIEVDDAHHETSRKSMQHKYRDAYARTVGWETVRIATRDIDKDAGCISRILADAQRTP
jgi:hypothetical protein